MKVSMTTVLSILVKRPQVEKLCTIGISTFLVLSYYKHQLESQYSSCIVTVNINWNLNIFLVVSYYKHQLEPQNIYYYYITTKTMHNAMSPRKPPFSTLIGQFVTSLSIRDLDILFLLRVFDSFLRILF